MEAIGGDDLSRLTLVEAMVRGGPEEWEAVPRPEKKKLSTSRLKFSYLGILIASLTNLGT